MSLNKFTIQKSFAIYLDDFEGEEFQREPVVVEGYDEFEVDTYIYVLKACDDIIDD